MTWLALCDFKTPPYLNKSLGGAALSPPASPGRIANSQRSLSTGSLVAEVLVSRACNHAFTLIEISSSDPETIGFSIRMDPLRATTLTLKTPHARTEIAVKSGTSFFDRRMRLTYSWDCENASGLLTLENLEDGWLAQSEFSNPQPMPLTLIEQLILGSGQRSFGPELDFFGFSARIEPVGLTVSLAQGTPIATPHGYQNIETLNPR